VKLLPVDWDEGRHRWADIASQPFADPKVSGFSYADADATLEHEREGATFAGSLAASGLKPNFAYQIKLMGRPGVDAWANEQLGRAGRWWAKQVQRSDGTIARAWRSNDEEYGLWKSRGFADGGHDVVFEGYLLFGFLLTDPAGSAARPLRLDSGFHVLWKTSQREPKDHDSPPTPHVVIARAASGWYPADLPDAEVAIYAEWEPGRARPGQCTLPAGGYRVQLVLTEESFHERGTESGSWATVLSAGDVAFTISARGA
jgi:hypothetical protein